MRERSEVVNRVTIITEAGLRLVVDGARGVSAGVDRQVVVHAGGREINVDLPPTAAVAFLIDE